jgi:hypothetical protein
VKHLKIDKDLAREMRKLQTIFAEQDNPLIGSNAFDEIERIIDTLTPAMPKSLYKPNGKLKSIKLSPAMPKELHTQADVIRQQIRDVKLCLENRQPELATRLAFAAGIEFAWLCLELGKVRPPGNSEYPINAMLRDEYAKGKSKPQKEIVQNAIIRFEKENPKKPHPGTASLMSHFHEIVSRKSR